MSHANYLFTSESVSEGHPDKVADAISDAILDAYLQGDPESRVACETLVTSHQVVIGGEVTSHATVDVMALARQVIRDIGYNRPELGFDANSVNFFISLKRQSSEIAMGVDSDSEKDQGAGDQGLMFGYACDETDALMPASIYYSHRLVKRLAELRKTGQIPWLRPDAKSQVTLRYENGRPVEAASVVISTQHSDDVSNEMIREAVIDDCIKPTLPPTWITPNTVFHINPTGRFVIGGPLGDVGLTGRKIIVDTYGGYGRHGGGAFSGKDPSKVDRSAAYMARNIAKTIVAAGLARKCEIQISYAIGVAEPLSVYVDTFGTGDIGEERLEHMVRDLFPLRPADLIRDLDLKKPRYRATAAYGHFGRSEPEFTWERTPRVEQLKG